ncbi:glutamate racemase [Patiriisocius marinistellae]|uniref:Glutamate racemase n=1 Tax=Patiriisocius marinistellae TaxID=2494560 RepID=A0A5J4G0U2_9FLAO|nr:glutamate racemase [Patiriisocius marinistellae]GEQ87388.1 glutamate racemase [Patiriisocius marinistellae]
MNKEAPIGIFDSGVGGTSIWKEIHALLPFENTIYLADSRNAPYGYKSAQEILQLSIKNTEQLLKMGCKIIVVACNTATTNAIDYLRKNYNVQIIGIEPAIKPAALQTTTKSIGILATKGTLSSALFHKTSQAFAKDLKVVEVIGEGLVPLIEKGALKSPQMTALLQKLLAPMIAVNIDHLVLGCSHYPYLIPQLVKLLPKSVKIIDSGGAVARHTQRLLIENKLLNTSETEPCLEFFSNSKTDTLALLLNLYKNKINITNLNF